jgi:CheY-like chemotaxis protein
MTVILRRRKQELMVVNEDAGLFVLAGKNGLPPSKGSKAASRNGNNPRSGERDDFPPNSAFPPYRILVVDDEPDIASIMKKGLERNGFQVVAFTNPVEALSSFSRHQYDIVLTDIRMPQMNGLELFRRLRAIDNDVLICFVTAYEQFRQEFEITHPEEPVGCFIPKPVHVNNLAATIVRKMEERESGWRKKL